MARTLCRVVLLVFAAVALFAVGAAPAPGTVRVIAGSCLIEFEAERSLTSIDITTPTPGWCMTTDGEAEGTFEALDVPVTAGTTCTAGVAEDTGAGSFELVFDPATNELWQSVAVTVAYEEPLVELVFTRNADDAVLVGEGDFLQTPVSHPACATSSHTFTWTGTIVFEDPVLEDVP